ncbi:MAG: hypothetical protein NC395_11915 [Prevotella sp.]|nr:hypothetical protein [Prevotella sp.]
MDIFKQYDTFKEKCAEFPGKLAAKFSPSCRLICHPAAENVLISECSEEEAHSNALCICRMADMLLMSADGEEWSAFNLAEARRIAEQDGYIYITDLIAEDAFLAEDWMINGKNDTIIVSEAYMREKGKRYAPVTPLTNKVLCFKKYSCGFLWKPSAPGSIACIDKDYIDGCFADFFDSCSETLPDLSESETIDFKLFDGEITIDVNTTRIRTIELFFERINEIADTLAGNAEILEICGYEFSAIDFLLGLTAAALKKNGIALSKEEFASAYYSPILNGSDTEEKLASLGTRCGNDDVDCIKLAFLAAVNAEYAEKIEYSAGDAGFYGENIRRLELGNYSAEEEKFIVSDLLSHRPADYRVFYFANREYPEEAENLAAIADFWKIAPLSEEEMENVVLGAYLLDENFDEQGRFCAGYEESSILKEQVSKVIDKYGLTNRECVEELEQRMEILDKERRTFNGTLFDTPEEMQLAVKNEAYVQDLCENLSALNESELNALDEHIENTTLDAGTKSKYKLKIKLAMNNVRSAVLEQKCLKLPIMSLDEILELRSKLLSEDYPEAVLKPFAAKIRDAFSAAQTTEIEAMLESSEDMTDEQLDGVSARLSSGRYDSTISDYYKNKVEEIKENNIRTKLHSMIDGFESFSKEKLSGLIDTLKESSFPKRLTYPLIRKVTDALNNYEINEAARTFEGVEFASEEQLERMKSAISGRLFSDEILAPYILSVEKREKELLDEELAEMCAGIENMSQEELDELRRKITDTERNFDEQLVSKYLDKITQRDCELQNSELAELCKYIFSMERSELDELKEKLADDKYDKDFTGVYYRKIAEREQELLVLELDRLCAGIDDADAEMLEKLKARILDDARYDDICGEYITAINNRIDAIMLEEYRSVIAGVVSMTAEEVEKFRKNAEEKRSEIGEELYAESIAAADERDNVLEDQAIEAICGDIESYGFEQAESVRARLAEEGFDPEKIAPYAARIDARITSLHTAVLDSYIEGIESMNKEQLIQAQIKIGEYAGPDHLKEKYNRIAENAIAGIADREIREMCGNINELSAKKSGELIRRINTMPLDETAKSRYIDALDAHIASLKEHEQREYISRLTSTMTEYSINAVHLAVPGMTGLFANKYENACATYISAGRYELPLLIHEGNNGDSFTMTTEYLHILNRGVMKRIRVDDIASFQAKKTLMNSVLTAVEKNGESSELPNALKKDVIENVAKTLTALVSFIHDRRSAEHMKELLENAVQEKAIQAAAMSAAVSAAPAVSEAPAVPEPVSVKPFAEEETAAANDAHTAYETEYRRAEVPAPAALEEISAPSVASIDYDGETAAAEEYDGGYAETVPETEEPEETSEPIEISDLAEPSVSSETTEPVEPVKPAPETAPEPVEIKVKFCDQCGARITSPTAKFCAECGNKLI